MFYNSLGGCKYPYLMTLTTKMLSNYIGKFNIQMVHRPATSEPEQD